MQYAADKIALQTARGGADAGGDIATNMLPPNIAGPRPDAGPVQHQAAASRRSTRPRTSSQRVASRTASTRSSRPATAGKEPKTAEALQAALKNVGINAQLDQYGRVAVLPLDHRRADERARKGYGIMIAGWGADFPTGYGFLQVLVDGRAIFDVRVTTTTRSSTTRRSTR